jgi:hypothetical protein
MPVCYTASKEKVTRCSRGRQGILLLDFVFDFDASLALGLLLD